jgi:hypothetical protein
MPRQPDEAPVKITKAGDAIWTRLAVDPLAIPLARIIARWSWVTPNRLTGCAFAFGLAAAGSFAVGWFRIAGLLFILRFFFDCLDGRVARLQRSSSARGASLDLAADVGGIALNFAAITWYLVKHGDLNAAIGSLLLAAVVFHNWVLAHRKAVAGALDPADDWGDGGSGGRWSTDAPVLRSWVRLAQRLEMNPVPWVIEADIVALGLAPLIISDRHVVGYVLWFTLAFYLVADIVNLRRILRLADEVQRAKSKPATLSEESPRVD